MEAVYQDKERDLREKYARMTREFEAEKLRIRNKLPRIASMATNLRDELNKCFFKPKLAIKLVNDIIDYSSKKETGSSKGHRKNFYRNCKMQLSAIKDWCC